MSCGCKDKKKIENAPPARSPYDQQAHELLAPTLPQLDLVRPEKPDRSRPLLEYFAGNAIGNSKPSLPSVFQLAAPMKGLSFQGMIPFNMVAFIMPLDACGPLLTDASLMKISQTVNGYGAVIGMPSIQGVDQYWIMRPGEVIDFGRNINGVAGFFAAPWSGCSPFGGNGNYSDQAGTVNCIINSQVMAQQQAANANWIAGGSAPFQNNNNGAYFARTHGPLFAPVLRPHFGNVHTVVAPFTRMPWVLPNMVLNPPNSTFAIPPGTRRMALTFTGGAVSYNGGTSYASGNLYGTEVQMINGGPGGRVSGATDVNVLWYGTDTQFHRHPSDDMVTTGRGQITPTHDCEIYDIEKSFQGIQLQAVSKGAGGLIGIGNDITAVTYVFSD